MLKLKLKKLLEEKELCEAKYKNVTLEDSFAYSKEELDIFASTPFGECRLDGTYMEFAITLESLLDLDTCNYTKSAKEDILHVIAVQNNKVIHKEYIYNPQFNEKIYISLNTKIARNETISFYVYIQAAKRLAGRLILDANVI